VLVLVFCRQFIITAIRAVHFIGVDLHTYVPSVKNGLKMSPQDAKQLETDINYE